MSILVIFLILIFLFSLVSRLTQEKIFSGPMVFGIAGVLIFQFTPELSDVVVKDHTILIISEVTLAIVLFAEATHLSLKQTLRESTLPARLLGIGMPLSIVLGAIVAALLFTDLSIWEAAILATILAPTDASLGAAVVSSKLVPHRIRQALEVEGGLNDGLSIPLLMLFIALSQRGADVGSGSWLVYTAQQIGFGLLVGIVVGWLGGWLMTQAQARNWIEDKAKQLGLLSLAILSWWLAEKGIHGNGFIAAFVAGSMVRLSFEDAGQHMAEFNESWGDLLIYFIFFLFGMIAGPYFQMMGVPAWLYGLLSLTLIRMLPVAIALFKTKLHRSSVLFLGLKKGSPQPIILLGVIATVSLSVLAHGISAAPGTRWYAGEIAKLGPEAPEHEAPSIL